MFFTYTGDASKVHNDGLGAGLTDNVVGSALVWGADQQAA
jgi:hypothetical protein